jgi:pyridoxamine 5'-phosphate oxidase
MINPIEIVKNYLNSAYRLNLKYPNAAVLCTSRNDEPDGRFILIKEVRDNGFVFYTNYNSKKGKDLELNPKACIVLYWEELGIQIRIRGKVEKISEEDSTNYFKTRPKLAQISAYISRQSEELESYEELLKLFEEYKKIFENKEVEKPKHWGGYILIPKEIEIWKEGEYRLHQRTLYYLENGEWKWKNLYP